MRLESLPGPLVGGAAISTSARSRARTSQNVRRIPRDRRTTGGWCECWWWRNALEGLRRAKPMISRRTRSAPLPYGERSTPRLPHGSPGHTRRCARRSGGLAARQEIAHAVERLEDVLGRVGVGEPHVALAEDAEIGPADDGDAGVVEQRIGKRLRLPAGALDVGKGVERALRSRAGDAGQAAETFHNHRSPLVELRHHAMDV